jgi:hypothetical protein
MLTNFGRGGAVQPWSVADWAGAVAGRLPAGAVRAQTVEAQPLGAADQAEAAAAQSPAGAVRAQTVEAQPLDAADRAEAAAAQSTAGAVRAQTVETQPLGAADRSEAAATRRLADAVRRLAVAAIAVSLAPVAAQTGARLLTPQPRQYERVEIVVDTGAPAGNPFDPNEARVDAEVRLPSGRVLRVPGFWFQDYRRSLLNPEAVGTARIERLTAEGRPGWRVRFASAEAGEHTVTVEHFERGAARKGAPLRVRVEPGARPGFLRVSPRNRRFLEHDSGRPFFAIGENLCMYEKREGTYYFDRLLEKLAANGGNYVRLWQEYYVPQDPSIVAAPGDGGFAGFPLETQATGLGRYDLASAWRLDHVAAQCERLDVYWQLTFEMTVWWQPRMKHRWPRNPYNAANGGPCRTPAEYFTNERARELVKRRLRYSVARWGYAVHLAAWELWNEVDNNDGFDPAANEAWHREMGAYLKSVDPWRHPVTTSWRDARMFALPEIDIVQAHSYWDAKYDTAEYSWQDTEHLMRPYGKPFFFGEQGVDNPAEAVKLDPEGRHFHDAMWATGVSGAAGTGLYWWWHNYVEPLDLYRHYKPLAAFLKDEDWPAREWKPVGLSRPSLPVSLKVYGIAAPDRALVWIHDPLAFRIVAGQAEKGPEQAAASVNVTGLADGAYVVEWWDTGRGALLRRDDGRVRRSNHFGYGLELKPPPFWGGIAARVRRKEP